MTTDPSDDEYEEKTLLVAISGTMDLNAARRAIGEEGRGLVRRVDSDQPMVQVGNSLFVGEWVQTLGTDLLFKLEDRQLRYPEKSNVRLKAEKAMLCEKDEETVDVDADEDNASTAKSADTQGALDTDESVLSATRTGDIVTDATESYAGDTGLSKSAAEECAGVIDMAENVSGNCPGSNSALEGTSRNCAESSNPVEIGGAPEVSW